MRCNGLPNTNCPSDLRKYLHQWQNDIETRNGESRNWLLKTNERTLLTQDTKVIDLTKGTLRKEQINLGDIYAERINEVLMILSELDESLACKKQPEFILNDLIKLKSEIRIFLKDYIDDFTYKILSYIERDMEIDRPGVSKYTYISNIFKTFLWSFSKDAQICLNPKPRGGDQNQHNEIEFPIMEMHISLPPSVELYNSALRGLWLAYDHFSDYCPSFKSKITRPSNINMLTQIKKEWRKRKEILKQVLDECKREIPVDELEQLDSNRDFNVHQAKQKTMDVDKLYLEYEETMNKLKKQAIGPEAYNLSNTDVNLRKYRIIGGIYAIDYLDTPQQSKQLNSRTFIRLILTPNKLSHKTYYQIYKTPPPPQAGVRRLPEEIEAEMRLMEKALDKLGLVTVQLPISVIWFEPPIVCRWETEADTLESDLTEGIKKVYSLNASNSTTDVTPSSTTASGSPLKGLSPRYDLFKLRKRKSSQKSLQLPYKEIHDFNMCCIPNNVDILSLLKDFILPLLPPGFAIRLNVPKPINYKKIMHKYLKQKRKSPNRTKSMLPKLLYLSRPKLNHVSQQQQQQCLNESLKLNITRITSEALDLNEPREFFIQTHTSKILKILPPITVHKTLPAEETNGQTAEMKCYMFSTLIEDLNYLLELQMPMQKELIQEISIKLNSKYSNEITVNEQVNVESATTNYSNVTFVQTNGINTTKNESEKITEKHIYIDHDHDMAENSDNNDDDDFIVDDDDDDDDDNDNSDDDSEYDVDDVDWFCNDDKIIADNINESNGSGQSPRKHHQHIYAKDNKINVNDYKGKLKATRNVIFTQGKWSTRDVHDTKFNEDKLSIQFRVGRLGLFGFALNRYSNMPYQTWELKPDLKNSGNILFSLTASLISLDISITADGYCVNNLQGGTTVAINDMIGKTLAFSTLKNILINSAIDIFPEEDAFCYTEGSCEKNFIMEMHLYNCMSTLALSHNFSWSRWNLLAGSRTAVLLMRELIEDKKMPNHSTLLVTPLKTSVINCTEVSASFNCLNAPGMDYYADLYQLTKVHAHRLSLDKQLNMHPVLRDHVATILKAVRPLSFC